MKRVTFIFFALILVSNIRAQYFSVDTIKLNNAYLNLMREPNSSDAQEAYFEAFPKNWPEYIATYQYSSDKKYNLSMYSLAKKHVDALCDNLPSIPELKYSERLVSLALGGRLDADAPNYLKDLLWQQMKIKMESIFSILSQLRKGHQMEFWELYWSNIKPDKSVPEEFARLKKMNEKKYPEVVKIMSDAYMYFYDGVNFASDGYIN